MLVIFKSKAGGDIIMFEENAKQILDLLNKDTDKGDAIVKLENEIERRKMIEAQEKAERERIEKEEQEKKEKEEEEEGKDPKDDRKKEVTRPEPPVSFSARTYPFMQLLKAANKKKKDIYWGVQT